MLLTVLLGLLVMLADPTTTTHADILDAFFGSKSAYEHGQTHQHRETCHASATSLQEHCPAEKIFILARHGTRYPTSKAIHKFIKLQTDLAPLNWTSLFHLVDEGLLAQRGVVEMTLLGARFAKRFPNIFASTQYHPRRIQFVASSKTRTLQSAAAFALGAYPNVAIPIETQDKDRDNVLRFHDNCNKYTAHKKTLIIPPPNSASITEIVKRVSKRLNHDVSEKQMWILWSACRFEQTVLSRSDSSCTFFSTEDAIELEHSGDVEDYWSKGFGHKLNYEMACLLLKDLTLFVMSPEEEKKDGQHELIGRFLFGHAETLMPLLALLGLFRDEVHLQGDVIHQHRKWRSGVLAPFGGNLAVVVRHCESSASTVELLHNERALDISHLCDGAHICNRDDFVRGLERIAGECRFEQVCGEMIS